MPSASSSQRHFAVVEINVSGYQASDRVFEIGVMLLNPDNKVEGEWETLVNPDTPVRRTYLGDLSNRDLEMAP